MREVVLGTAGHVDHGKTSLVRALTGIETDRLKEEKKRGITIELGFAYLDLPCGHRLGIVDVPGHERFVKNMVAGAAGIDLVAFVIAADEGIMPQTREHFEICRLLGIKKGFVVITKKDMVEPDWLELVQEEVKEYFSGTFLDGSRIVTVSSTTGEGITEVREILDAIVSSWEFAEAFGPFRLPIDRIFNMKGFGSVITGTSISGRIGVGEDIMIYPGLKEGKIRGIQVHGKSVDVVEAGNRTAINLQGLEKEMVNRGDVLASPGCLRPSYMLDADFLYLSSSEKKLKNRTRVRVHLGTAEIMGRIVLLDSDELAPGNEADIQLLLEEPVSVWPGDHYVVRSYSPVMTIGGGMIFNGCAFKRRRFRTQNKEAFQVYRHGSLEERFQFHVLESGMAGLSEADLSVRTALFGNRFKKILNGPVSSRKIVVVDSEQQLLVAGKVYDAVNDAIIGTLDAYHRKNPLKLGIAKEELRNLVNPRLGAKLFQLCLNNLTRKNSVVQEEAIVRLPEHQVSLQADEKKLRSEIEAMFVDSGLTPPTLKEVHDRFEKWPRQLVGDMLNVLAKENVITRVTGDLYFYSAALVKLQDQLAAFLEKEGEIDAPRFKELTGLTRKFSIPLLEYFDKVKLTLRVGDKRVLRKKK